METQLNSNCWYKDVCKQPTCQENCMIYTQLKWQMNNSGLPECKQAPISLYITQNNKCDKPVFTILGDIRKNIVSFVQEGGNLCLTSKYTGNGKTSWAIKLLQTYLHYTAGGNYENLKGMFVSVPEFLLKLKDFNNPISNTYKQRLQNVDLVVWDEVALTGVTPYDYNQLYVYIETRMMAGKANIFTCNYSTQEELEQVLGSRLTSRIWNSSQVLEFKGMDERG